MTLRLRTVLLPVLLAAVLGPGARASAATVLVPPYAPVGGDRTPAEGEDIARVVRQELVNQGLEVRPAPTLVGAEAPMDPAGLAAGSQAADALARARAASGQEAEGAWRAAVAAFEGLPTLDREGLTAARLGLAEVLVGAGKVDEAVEVLGALAAVAPEVAVPEALGSAWRRARVARLRQPRGAVAVRSAPAGARVFLDGEAVGRTPVRLEGVVPGRHWLKVETLGDRWTRALVVEAGGTGSVEAAVTPRVVGPAGELVTLLSTGRLEPSAVAAALALAADAGADHVVLGVFTQSEGGYVAESWWVEVATGAVRPLPGMAFDLELVNASLEAYGLAGRLKFTLGRPAAPLTLPVSALELADPAELPPTPVGVGPAVPEEAPVDEAPEVADADPSADEAPPAAPEGAQEAPPVAPVVQGPVAPVGPVTPEAARPAPAEQREAPAAPVAAGAIGPEDTEARGPAAGPVGPVGPVRPAEPPPEPEVAQGPVRREPASVGGEQARIEIPDDDGAQRYAAVDIEDIAIPKDEIQEDRGWPWWAYALVSAGVVAAGAGGYWAADQAGVFDPGTPNMTVNVRW